MSGGLSAPGGFFADADFDYEARIALGCTVSGIGDVPGSCMTCCRLRRCSSDSAGRKERTSTASPPGAS